MGHTQEEASAWAHDTIAEGLAACEALVAGQPGPFCFGTTPGLADLCLVPQMYNARRFAVDLAPMPRLRAAEAACLALPAFADTAPEAQPDAE
jgi:maleylpyruvate isomerase